MTVARLTTETTSTDVLTLTLTRARYGRASLEVRLADSPEGAGLTEKTPITLELAGEIVFTGGVWRVGREGGITRACALEAFELDTALPARFYQGTDAALIARDILRESQGANTGGVLEGGLEGSFTLARAMPKYARRSSSAIAALNDLCQLTRAAWRTRRDGRVNVLQDGSQGGLQDAPRAERLTWGDDLIGFDPACQSFTALVRPDLEPGQRITADPYDDEGEYLIERVMHCVEGKRGASRTHVWWSSL
jgi:hypothetical protein